MKDSNASLYANTWTFCRKIGKAFKFFSKTIRTRNNIGMAGLRIQSDVDIKRHLCGFLVIMHLKKGLRHKML